MEPFDKENAAFMARTNPVQDGIISLRSRDPSPGIRLLGAFCEQDVFLGLSWHWRRRLLDRIVFSHTCLAATGIWDRLLPDCRRLVSDHLEDYISEDVHTA